MIKLCVLVTVLCSLVAGRDLDIYRFERRASGTPYPIPDLGLNASSNSKLLLYEEAAFSQAEILLLNSLAGAVARTRPLILRNFPSTQDFQSLQRMYNVTVQNITSVGDMLRQVQSFGLLPEQYVLATELQHNATNAAISAASSYSKPTFVVHNSLASLVSNLTMVFNASGHTPLSIWNHFGSDSWSKNILTIVDNTNLGDYAIFSGAFSLYADPVAEPESETTKLFYHALSTLSPLAAVMGWIPGFVPRELVLVESAAAYGAYVHCADSSKNLATLSGFGLPNLTQPVFHDASLKEKVPDLQANTSVHTVAFLWSDGDNIGGYDQVTLIDNNHFQSPLRGQVPMGWTISPALIELDPSVMYAVYQNATVMDEMVAGPSGVGYTYPDALKNLDDFAEITKKVLNRTDLHTLNLISGAPDFGLKQALSKSSPYLAYDQIEATFYFNYFSYNELRGQAGLDEHGKPVMGARFWMCNLETAEKCLTSCGPGCVTIDHIKKELQKQPKDINSIHGYTLISMDAWITTVENVVTLVNDLNQAQPGGFRFLLPHQFAKEVQRVLASTQP